MAGIQEIDIHGMNQHQAKTCIDAQLRKTKAYRLRVIHGFHGGVALQSFVRKEYKGHPKVLRVEIGYNAGETDLVLREY